MAQQSRVLVYTLRAHLREGLVDSQYEDIEAYFDFKFRERLEELPGHVALQTCHSAQSTTSFFKLTLVSNDPVDEALLEEVRLAMGAKANEERICSSSCATEKNPYVSVKTEQGRSCTVPIQRFPVPRLRSLQDDESWIRAAIYQHIPAKARIASITLMTERLTTIVEGTFSRA